MNLVYFSALFERGFLLAWWHCVHHWFGVRWGEKRREATTSVFCSDITLRQVKKLRPFPAVTITSSTVRSTSVRLTVEGTLKVTIQKKVQRV